MLLSTLKAPSVFTAMLIYAGRDFLGTGYGEARRPRHLDVTNRPPTPQTLVTVIRTFVIQHDYSCHSGARGVALCHIGVATSRFARFNTTVPSLDGATATFLFFPLVLAEGSDPRRRSSIFHRVHQRRCRAAARGSGRRRTVLAGRHLTE